MKKLFLLFCICNGLCLKAQTCCSSARTCDEFVLLAKNEEFKRSHDEPLSFIFESSHEGKMISFPIENQKEGKAYLIKAHESSKNYLFVYQEWWGLNDHIKKEAEKLYESLGEKINVIAIDLYDGKVTSVREEAAKLMQEADEKRIESIILGALKYVGNDAKIASIGWCFGGGWSLKSALLEGKQAVGCVMYYGMPIKEIEKLKLLECSVLGIFAGKEKWISPEIVKEFDKNMTQVGKKLEYKIFDAEHAFANPSNPNFHQEYTKEAFEKAINYLKLQFK